ncbi:beta-ketoacyl-[acyl-carrier-protein] synthase family protein [Sphingobacterium hotanense]|uniref:beta-ketoacyl-[acyl-carrier-protein] synthase family protein n=1 Tax=Sphingobacterium hotanense TaxID=649196 RepID=UPI0021A6B274|nr:beta-ketoacyl-[acyl-carrier-protein] synthase family protein [Sphingobacterium hotanense]MCT1525189.1 beta-ketoacyl-[acyl-carrier-protein] synthase family protein [Sphingobacterium hotanense]
MPIGVAITGMGIVSSIGLSVDENFQSLVNRRTGISYLENFQSKHAGHIKVGEIKVSNEEFQDRLKIPLGHSFTRTSLLGAYAAKQAIVDAGISDINSVRTGLISATSVGGMDTTEKHFKDFQDQAALQKFINSHNVGDSNNKIADYLGIRGMVTGISTACSSAANAIMLGSALIETGRLDRVIVGGTDALSKFTINGFNSLMILSDTDNTPFDQDRKGLNLGEAAAYLVLESEEQVQKENKQVLAYLCGYGNSNDAYHQTASSETGEGAYLAIEKALKKANLLAKDIDYINVHGTATTNNDLSEGRALQRIFDEVPDFSSTKSFTGHTLAAAAAIEAVYSILALRAGMIFPTLNFKNKMEEFELVPTTELREKNINHVLSNSFGFGGNCSSLIFSKS